MGKLWVCLCNEKKRQLERVKEREELKDGGSLGGMKSSVNWRNASVRHCRVDGGGGVFEILSRKLFCFPHTYRHVSPGKSLISFFLCLYFS